jgi:UDP-N-acetylglucosamine 2-epimerase
MRVPTAADARPQLIKSAAVHRVLRRSQTEMLLHTGRHCDYDVSEVT